jgi:hypothetical protein
MKWFKHDSDAHTDAKLKRVKHKYGITGFGLYWYCVELVARKIDSKNITFELEEDAELIAIEWGLEQKLVEEILHYFVEIGLFECEKTSITCFKLAKRLDDTNSKNTQIKSILNRISQSKSENVGEGQNISGQIRRDKNRIEKDHDPEDLKLAGIMFESIKLVVPKTKPPNLESWADQIRLMREQDNLSLTDIRNVFAWANQDSFWQSNILSPTKLRKQFPRLHAASKKTRPPQDDFQGVMV